MKRINAELEMARLDYEGKQKRLAEDLRCMAINLQRMAVDVDESTPEDYRVPAFGLLQSSDIDRHCAGLKASAQLVRTLERIQKAEAK